MKTGKHTKTALDLRHALDQIRGELEFHEQLMAIGRMGGWELYSNGGLMYLSSAWASSVGLANPPEHMKDYFRLVDEENRDRVSRDLSKAAVGPVGEQWLSRHKINGVPVISRGMVVRLGLMVGIDIVWEDGDDAR